VVKDLTLTEARTRFLGRLQRRLRGGGFEYFAVNEWHDGHRHFHILIRTGFNLTRAVVRELWGRSLPGVDFTHYCQPVGDADAVAKYVVKDLNEDLKKELPPRSFRGRVISYSKGFFVKKPADLWAEQLEEWREARRPKGVDQWRRV
jgi:hypothetical protein